MAASLRASRRLAPALALALVPLGVPRAQTAHARDIASPLPRLPSGRFGFLHHPLALLASRAATYLAADLDGDGHLDLLAPTNDPRAYVLWGDGSGAFQDVQEIPLAAAPEALAAVGDVDGDGDQDLLLGTASQLRNDGTGHFSDWSASMPALQFRSVDIAIGDVDGDGDDDFLTGSDVSPRSRLFLNQGGTLVEATAPAVGTETVIAVRLADVDGDGDQDALLHRYFDQPFGADFQRTQLYRNDGSGAFPSVEDAAPDTSSQRLVVADLDGDGDVDLLNGVVRWNDGSGLFTPGYTLVLGAPFNSLQYPLLLADLDEDGDLDAVALRSETFDELFLNDGGGVLATASPSALETTGPAAFVAGDLDGDHDVDLMHGRRLLLNDGSGVFTDASVGHVPSAPADTIFTSMAIGDLDEDGAPDVAQALNSPFQVFRLLLSDGGGVFHEPASYPPLTGITYDADIGDVDGDGHLDLYLPAFRDKLLLGDGAGGLTDVSATLPSGSTTAYATGLGDLDGDGDLDVVRGQGLMAPAVLYLNDGSGGLALAVPNLPTLNNNAQDVLLEDIDVDGDADVLIANGFSASGTQYPSRLYRNDGGGIFTNAPAQIPSTAGEYCHSFAVADVDGDGDRDVLLGTGLHTTFWTNVGGGRYQATPGELPLSLPSFTVGLADVDGDGDSDAIYDHFVLRNLERQLAWRWRPRSGEPLAIEHYGHPGVLWFLNASLVPGRSSLPPYGTLLLDAGSAELVAADVIGWRGKQALSLDPGTLPGMAGATLYLQSVIGTPLQFSNLERVVFTP